MSLTVAHAAQSELRVCADPDNLPYSHQNGSGFENRIAELVARELDARLVYTWFPQRRGFVRRTLDAQICDVVIGVPTASELVRTTAPYYRSSYVFLYPADRGKAYRSFDDPALGSARIGIQLVGDDFAATPPGHALAMRGIVDNVVGYPVYGVRPQAERIVDALTKGEIDVALVWGPQAAYYARRAGAPLEFVPAQAPPELVLVPFEFSMSMGVRKQDAALAAALDAIVSRRGADIETILDEYGIPRAARRLSVSTTAP